VGVVGVEKRMANLMNDKKNKGPGGVEKIEKRALELLVGLLQFDAEKRWGSKQALMSGYFRSIKTRDEDILQAENIGVYENWAGEGEGMGDNVKETRKQIYEMQNKVSI